MIAVRAGGVKPPLEKSAPPPPPRIAFQFRALPCATSASREISQSAKLLHAALLDAARRKGSCTYTNRSLGAMIGRSPATVKRLLSELEAAGLARRDLVAGGRVRSGVVPFAPGVAHSRDGGQTAVAQSRPPGGSPSAPGVAHSRSASIQSPIQNDIPDAARSSLGGAEDAASRVASGPEAAAYLRACIQAGRRGEPMPPPPAFANSQNAAPVAGPDPRFPDSWNTGDAAGSGPRFVNLDNTGGATPPDGAPPRPIMIHDVPSVPPVAFTAEVGRMVKALGERLRSEDVGRRRVGPKKLARQLAELRRRHARRG